MGHDDVGGRLRRFGVYQADLRSGELYRDGVRLRIQEQPFRVLAALLEHPGEIVMREDLRALLWPEGTYVEFDAGLNAAVKKLRSALGDDAENPRFVQTVPRRGYRFIAPVAADDAPGSAARVSTVAGDTTSPGAASVPAQDEPLPLVPPERGPAARHGAEPATRWYGRPAWLVLAGFAAGLSVAVWALLSPGSTASGTPPQARSLVVLPFENRSADATQDYFAEGIGDGIAARLAQLPGLRVINRNTARIYLASGKPRQAIGRELGVDVVLDGTVEHAGGDIAIDIQLVRAATDDRLWSRAYRRPLTEILALERELSDDVARQFQLQGQLAAAAGAVPLVDPQAFEDYLQGQHYFALRTQESLPRSIRAYERSIARAPDFARSHAGLAHSYIVLPFLLAEYPRDVYALARAAAERAIELDASISDAHLAMAEVRLYADWDWAGAEQSFRRALALNPGSATAHQWYAEFLAIVGRYDESIREIDTTLLLNPLSSVAHHQAGNIYLQARQWEKSAELQDRAIALDPRSGGAHGMKARALYFLGRDAEGAAAEQQACGLYWPDGSRRSLCDEISRALARGGRPALREAQRRVAETLPRPDYYLARFGAARGDHDAAISRLAVSIERRDPDVTWLLADPEFDALRSDPRFLHQVSRIGLAPGQRATR